MIGPRRPIGTIGALVGLGAAVLSGVRGLGPVPPLGSLLDPANGAWAAVRFADLPSAATARIPNLSAPVDVRYDRRGVPHIFAATVDDAVRALGYVVARDRLFQLEVQTRAASGRLTEWAGPRALEADREMRRLGLPRSAERLFSSLADTSAERRTLLAYADGVNAYIAAIGPAEWPIEYKLIGARPERWQPVNSAHLFTRLGWTLAYLTGERARLAVAALVGDSAARALFPIDAVVQEPIQPNGEGTPRFAFRRIPPPGPPDSSAARLLASLGTAGASEPNAGDGDAPRSFASNNWAVAPRRTRNGFALLEGDPHLQLTLPSIWYEVHLVVPGRLDVYGVTVPGSPGVIIGFNRDVAWSFTNTGADVLDFFHETVDDSLRPKHYLMDGTWRSVETRVERYVGKHGEVVATDTLFFTHRGPLTHEFGQWLSMRWLVLEGKSSVGAFLGAAAARSARDFLDDMARNYVVPAQNMIAADRAGHIAIRSTGLFPLRSGGGDGLTIRDGAHSANDWQGFWPLEKYPQSFDPPQGFLASANQQPIDPRQASVYLGYEAAYDPWRAVHINRLLRADSAVTPDDMRRFETDPGNERADLLLPYLIAAGKTVRARGDGSPQLDSAIAILSAWDRRYTKENERTVLFEAATRQLAARTWDELAPNGGRPIVTPTTEILLELLQDSSSVWWDDRRTTDRIEHRDDILAAGIAAAYDSLVRQYGPPAAGGWRWDKVQPARVAHMLGLRGFSALGVPVQGGPGTLNPAGPGGFGPSWRMVVELGPAVRAMGTYPGGQSGNPASPRYLDRLPLWRDGLLDTLFMPRDTAEIGVARTRARLTLVARGAR